MRVATITGGLCAATMLLTSIAAGAATLCVNPIGSGGCAATIGAAVTAANPGDTITVAKGTYHEIVVIDKALALIGANRKTTIIDAAGLSVVVNTNTIANGIFVDGIDNAGLSGVLISGFTIRNAKFEGILIANATSVTATDNIVTLNDGSLASPNCPGIPSFETNEGFDCGEAIHLLGADHSIVSNNLVEKNAGGILISDDTAAAHDNLVEGNTVRNNPFDCGITLASHAPAAFTMASSPFGVTHNTITGNLSSANGLDIAGAGAGVGIFDSVPGTINSGNVVINNTLTKNGLPGVAMHGHAPGQFLNDNQIVDNVISKNGQDTKDAATPGPTGINVFSVTAATGTVIAGNVIKDEAFDVVVNTAAPANVDIHLNDLMGKGAGVANLGSSTATADAIDNFWGCAKGPGTPGCSTVSGAGVLTAPFAAKPF